jgi:6-pyruvoyltetrahydropterin/6-carboxytetrahydropterin synthase
MENKHNITREIGIDCGHRVTYHGSKCKNIHGHRYTVQATCIGPLFAEGEQQGMVLDFGFLKEEMMNEIDALCDHGTVLWLDDPIVRMSIPDKVYDIAFQMIQKNGSHLIIGNEIFGKLYLVPFVPTAENLAKHWYERLAPRVKARTEGQATLKKVHVGETPNCWAAYEGEQNDSKTR